MGLITKEVDIRVTHFTIDYYKNLGYECKSFDILHIPISQLQKGSRTKIEYECDECGKHKFTSYCNYNKFNDNGKIYCQQCALKIYRNSRVRKDKDARNYPEYLDFIKRVLYRDNYKCRICGSKNKIQVHHLDGYSWCHEKRVDDTNGITLCEDCHKLFHSAYGTKHSTREQFEEWIGEKVELLKSNYEKPQDILIYCLEDNKTYTINDFCNEKNADRTQVLATCDPLNRRKSIKGCHVFYLDDYKKLTKEKLDSLLKNKNHREIICVETQERFETITEVSKKYNVGVATIIHACKTKHISCGYHWMYLDEYEKNKNNIKFEEIKCYKIICIDTNEIFNSLREASKAYNLCSNTLSKKCKTLYQSYGGHYWLLLNIYNNLSDEEKETYKNLIESNQHELEYKKHNDDIKSIICIETNEIFNSIKDACKKYNLSHFAIKSCCLGKHHTYNNKHWLYLEDYKKLSTSDIENLKHKQIICVETKEIFSSFSEISKKYKLTKSCISDCCNHKQIYCDKKHWLYLNEYEKMTEDEIKKLCNYFGNVNNKKVVCLDTREVFNSIEDANRKTKANNIYLCCCGKLSSSGGYHWVYFEDFEKMTEEEINKICNKPISNRKQIICLETKEKFNSLIEISKILSVNEKTIRKHCRNKTLIKDIHIMYLEDYEKMSEEEIKKLIS